jgi:hypothetical protein
MYQVTVTTRYLNNKDVLRLLIPLFVWMILFFALFFTMCITDISILVLPLFIAFLCITPIFIRGCIIAQKVYRASFIKMDIVITARDGILYKDSIKLNAEYDERGHEVWLDDTHDAGKYNRRHTTFWGTISGEDVEGFLAFCRENKINLEIVNE